MFVDWHDGRFFCLGTGVRVLDHSRPSAHLAVMWVLCPFSPPPATIQAVPVLRVWGLAAAVVGARLGVDARQWRGRVLLQTTSPTNATFGTGSASFALYEPKLFMLCLLFHLRPCFAKNSRREHIHAAYWVKVHTNAASVPPCVYVFELVDNKKCALWTA